MLATSLIAFREGLEAALIVGILLGYLKKTGRLDQRWYAWIGVIAAIAMSIGVAAIIQWIGAELEGTAEQIFEGVTMFVAVALLTWMIYWMRIQARGMKSSLEREMNSAITAGQKWGLVTVAFTAVFREGIETALFLSAAAFASDSASTLIGAVIGLTIAVVVGYFLYASTVRLNLRQFFNVTSVLLLVFAAGLFSRGIHEFQEAGVFFTMNEHLWNSSWLLNEDSTLGAVLKTLVGYSSSPSLESVVGYVVYWLFILLGMRWLTERMSTNSAKTSAGMAKA